MIVYLVVVSLLMKEVLLLKMLQVTVPSSRVEGQLAELKCDYDLQSDTLYSVEWYRNNEHFYRYMPNISNQAFGVEAANVDIYQSNDKRLVLNQVTLKSAGLYHCEVTADAPSFTSVRGSGRMEIVSLSSEQDRITGNEQENEGGDYTFLNWMSGPSNPAATLTWNLDGKKTTDPELLVEDTSTQDSYGLVSTTLALRIPSDKSVQVQCTVRVTPERQKRSEAVVGNNSTTDRKEPLLIRSSAGASTLSAALLVLPFALFVGALKKSQA